MSHSPGISVFGVSACSITLFGFTIELNVYHPESEPESDDADFEPTYVNRLSFEADEGSESEDDTGW